MSLQPRDLALDYISFSCSDPDNQAEHARCTFGPAPRAKTSGGHLIDQPIAPVCVCSCHIPPEPEPESAPETVQSTAPLDSGVTLHDGAAPAPLPLA